MKCPKCEKGYGIYIRIRTGEGVCRNCGYVDKKEKFEEKKPVNVWQLLDRQECSDNFKRLIEKRKNK
jgi:transcription initiation factor TFIIIB Brf1 subunit/transcription initiation factor TFIIB